MANQHLIHRCSWKTEFDTQSRYVELQDFISDWSKTVLVRELGSYFDTLCPSTQTWRIPELNLDFGEIDYENLGEELPRRLRESLQVEFARIQHRFEEASSTQHLSALDAIANPVEVATLNADYNELQILATFLRHGVVPWWSRGLDSIAPCWDRQLIANEVKLIELVRQYMRENAECDRFVWQFGTLRARRLVQLLEPWQGETLGHFIDELVSAGQFMDYAIAPETKWQEVLWITLLRYLLVERGRFFNRTTLIKFILEAITKQFQLSDIDYANQLREAFLAMPKSNRAPSPYLQTLLEIGQSALLLKRSSKGAVNPDFMLKFQTMVRGSLVHIQVGTEIMTLGEVFFELAHQRAHQLKKFLQIECRSDKVRQFLVYCFGRLELKLLISMMAPSEHSVVLEYLAQIEIALQKMGSKQFSDQQVATAWGSVTHFILQHSAHGIQLKQLINHSLTETLIDVSAHVPIDRQQFLDAIIHPVGRRPAGQHDFTLLSIYHSLKEHGQRPESDEGNARLYEKIYRVRLEHYLEFGREITDSGMSSAAILQTLLTGSRRSILVDVIDQVRTRLDSSVLSQRLLILTGYSELATLFEVVVPHSSGFCMQILARLTGWKREGSLVELTKIDCGLQLPCLVLEALPKLFSSTKKAGNNEFDQHQFLANLIQLFVDRGVEKIALTKQLQISLDGHKSGDIDEVISALSSWTTAHIPLSSQQQPKLKIKAGQELPWLKKSSLESSPDFKSQQQEDDRYLIQDDHGDYLNDPSIVAVARCLLVDGRLLDKNLPSIEIDLVRLLGDLCYQRPKLLRSILEPIHVDLQVQFRLQQTMPLAWMFDAIQKDAPQHKAAIALVAQLSDALAELTLGRLSTRQLLSTLYEMVLIQWINVSWHEFDIGLLAQNYARELLRKFQLPPLALQQALLPFLTSRPRLLQKAIQDILLPTPEIRFDAVGVAASARANATSLFNRGEKTALNSKEKFAIETRMINNAGLVLLHGFFETLFSRLGLMQQGRFIDHQAQRHAVHYLQFLVTGHQQTPEHYLTFNKVLCGLSPETPIELGITMSADAIALCEGLLNSVIQHWSANGSANVDGFRGNWLVRNGSLSEEGEHWQLTVERSAYDVLLQSAPFSYSMIRLQWMEKAVFVTWPT